MDPMYEIQDGVLLHCVDPAPVITVPEGVREIGRGAFLKPVEVILPEGVRVLQEGAFCNCENLRRVVLPSTLREIRREAFSSCVRLTDLVLPPGITEIPELCFYCCFSLTRLTIPEGVRSIGSIAFWRCQSLTSLTLPSTLEQISTMAFGECRNLREVTLPAGVTELPSSLFSEVSLLSLQAPGAVRAELDGKFCQKAERLVLPRMSIRTIPAAWKAAAMRGFAAWERQGGETDPEIRKEYLTYLRSRRKFLLGDAARDTDLLALMIREAVLPENLTDILLDKIAQAGRGEDTAMLLDYRNRTFGEPDPEREARKMMRSLSRDGMTAAEFRTSWLARKKAKKKDQTLVLQKYLGADTNILIPSARGKDPVTELGNGIFEGSRDIVSVYIPEGVTTIGDRAFARCPNLQRVELPLTLKTIGKEAFLGCPLLEEIVLPENVRSLGTGCFQDCRGLLRVTLSRRLKLIPEWAFSGCTALEEVTFHGCVQEIGAQAFLECVSLPRMDLPRSLRHINGSAFQRCRSLVEVRFPPDLETIGDDAFLDCYALRELDLPVTVHRLGEAAFGGCSALERVSLPSRNPLFTGPITWAPRLFQDCINLRQVRIPAQLTTLQGSAFLGCSSLVRWDVDPENPALEARGPWLTSRDGQLLYASLPGLSGDVVIPDGVTRIWRGAAQNRPGITSVTFPSSLNRIEAYAFADCASLTRVTFLGTPDVVSSFSFQGSPVRKALTFPDGTRVLDF